MAAHACCAPLMPTLAKRAVAVIGFDELVIVTVVAAELIVVGVDKDLDGIVLPGIGGIAIEGAVKHAGADVEVGVVPQHAIGYGVAGCA